MGAVVHGRHAEEVGEGGEQIDARGQCVLRPWRDAGPLIEDLLDGRIAGKAVLTVD